MKKTILVVYFARDVYPLRNAIKTHLFCFKNYSKNRIVYLNIAFGFPEKLLKGIHIDVIIFHTSFLGLRWNLDGFSDAIKKCQYLQNLNCLKVAMPQDEFYQTESLNDFFNQVKISHILTCAFKEDWNKIYDKINFENVKMMTVLTGYIDEKAIKRIKNLKKRCIKRNIDIGYRAWKTEYWLGEHGMKKVKIADAFSEIAKQNGLNTDISLEEKKVFLGDEWFKFLLSCKAILGVEGGASVLDKDGHIKNSVDKYISVNPLATFEETRANCFPCEDNYLGLACISPRHFEACITETCQFLIEGNYNGILIPWKHYVPVKSDYSNIQEVLDILSQPKKMRNIVETAYKDIVDSNKWSYKAFIEELESEVINKVSTSNNSLKGLKHYYSLYKLYFRDIINWQFIKFSVLVLNSKAGKMIKKNTILKKIIKNIILVRD
ncbi:MAG: hypothetical protein ACM3KR_09890 [Deltaproteobacteria bacterium]